MKLTSAAKYFDKLAVIDAYSDEQAMLGQMDLYDDSQRDGLTTVRRILSVAPGLDMPSRHAVKLGSDVYLVSHLPAYDYFQSSPIRSKFIVHRADGLAEIVTVLQELTNVNGTAAYAALLWLKGGKEVDESSEMTNILTAYFAKGESVQVGDLVYLDGAWYFVKDSYITASGFQAATIDQLDMPNFEMVGYGARTYNPVTDAYSVVSTNVKALYMRWQSKFEYMSPATAKYVEGDDVVLVAAAAVVAPKTGDRVTLSFGVREVVDVQQNGSVWHLHVRRV